MRRRKINQRRARRLFSATSRAGHTRSINTVRVMRGGFRI
ncbi:hypothetical protein [Dipodfec virus UOA04_Rod_861]|nr:hypothetical protein [Dipodfec virus UOA04_Rod_861]